jgi:hypothetical protein
MFDGQASSLQLQDLRTEYNILSLPAISGFYLCIMVHLS